MNVLPKLNVKASCENGAKYYVDNSFEVSELRLRFRMR